VRRAYSLTAAVAAVLLGVLCALAVKWYVVDVLIGLRDAADRSLQFWGLAVLGMGLVAGLCAVGLGVVAWRLGSRTSAARRIAEESRVAG
jgi:hypothetical protein